MSAFAAGADAMHALAFYKGQRPYATSADAASDLAMAAIYIGGAVVVGYRIADNHSVHPDDPQ